MTEFTKSYTLSKVQQLIDLNHDAVNFRLKFTVQSPDQDKVFHMVIASQSQLDSGDEIEFKDVNGMISGEVENNNNVYQNYYMILKSSNPQTVNVSILLEQLPEYIEQQDNMNQDDIQHGSNVDFELMKKVILFVELAVIVYYLINKYGNPLKELGVQTKSGTASLLTKLKELPVE